VGTAALALQPCKARQPSALSLSEPAIIYNVAMQVAGSVLLEGVWFSLAQCGSLLSGAVTLYKAGKEPTAVGLAMLGREELGKYRLLQGQWRESERTGVYPTVGEVQAACAEHVEKQRKATLSFSFAAAAGSLIDTAIRAQIKHKPQDAEYQQAEQVLQTAIKAGLKRAPEERHNVRMRALYVDLDDSGSSWRRPEQISPEEAKKLLNDAVNDYAIQRDRMDPDQLRGRGDVKLADALEAWQERPILPEPVWLEYF
jgi:AbiV family abortive infection protein